jgi:hypothetical protein
MILSITNTNKPPGLIAQKTEEMWKWWHDASKHNARQASK